MGPDRSMERTVTRRAFTSRVLVLASRQDELPSGPRRRAASPPTRVRSHRSPSRRDPVTNTPEAARYPERGPSCDSARKLERLSDGREMDLQLMANEENEDCAQGRKDEAGGMVTFVSGTRKHVGDGSTEDRPDDSEHDRPKDRHVCMHDRFGEHARN